MRPTDSSDSQQNIIIDLVHYAISRGDWHELKRILDQGISINIQNNSGFTPLHLAAMYNQSKVCDALIKHGANLSLKDNHGKRADEVGNLSTNPLYIKFTSFFQALREGNTSVIQEYLRDNVTWLCHLPHLSNFPAKLGTFIQAYEQLGSSAKKGFLLDSVLNYQQEDKRFPISVAGAYIKAGLNNSEELQWLIDHGADLHAVHDSQGNALLDLAILSENMTAFEYLQKRGAKKTDAFTRAQLLLRERPATNKCIDALTLLFKQEPFSKEQLSTLLQIAVQENCALEVVTFLSQQPNVDFQCTDKEGNTLLHLAVTQSLALVNYLVEKGLSLTATNNAGQTPEQIESSRGFNIIDNYKNRIIGYISGKSHIKPEYFTQAWLALNYDNKNYQSTLVHMAAGANNVEALKELKKMYGDEWANIINKTQNKAGGNRTPLASAVRSQSTAAIKYLLENGADPSIICFIDGKRSQYACSPFAYCVVEGWEQEVDLFLQWGNPKPDLNQRFDYGQNKKIKMFEGITPLQAAIAAGRSPKLILSLVKAGADVSIKHFGKAAAFTGSLLGGRAPNPLKEIYHKFLTLLDKAGNNAIELHNFLKIEGMNPTWLKIVDQETNLTAIHVLASKGHIFALRTLATHFPEIVKPLLNQADETKHKRTPLHHAILKSEIFVLQWLLTQTIDINAQDADGNTAYHLAIESGNEEIISLLRKSGVDKNIRNNKKELAEEISTGFLGLSKNILQLQKEKFEEAIRTNNIVKIKKIYGKNPNLLHDNPETILKLAQSSGAVGAFQYLGQEYIIKIGTDDLVKKYINKSYLYGDGKCTLAQIIAINKCWDLVDWYHQHGADFNQGKPDYPIYIAAKDNDKVGIESLLRAGADPAVFRQKNGEYKSYPYLRQKAQLIFEIITISNELLWDFNKLSDSQCVDMETLTSFEIAATKTLPWEWKTMSAPHSVYDIFTHAGFKEFFKVPYEDLESQLESVKQNSKAYKKSRAELLKLLVDPFLDRFNDLFTEPNGYNSLKAGIIELKKIDPRRGQILANYHNDVVLPSLKAIEKDSKNWPIKKSTFDYTELSAEKFKTISEAIPILEKNFEKLKSDIDQAKKEIYQEQKDAYEKLKDQIKELNRLIQTLPVEILDQYIRIHRRQGTSLRTIAQPCYQAIQGLVTLSGNIIDNPSLELLRDNEKYLQILQKNIVSTLRSLQNAEKDAEKNKQQGVRNELKAANVALDKLRPLWKGVPKDSLLRNYWVSLSENVLPQKEYYSDELKSAIQTIRKNYATVAKLLGTADTSTMPLLTVNNAIAEQILLSGKKEDFQQALQQLTASVNQLFPLLEKAITAEAQEVEQKAKLHEEIRKEISTLNTQEFRILLYLQGNRPFQFTLMDSLNEFRKAVGCENRDLAGIVVNKKTLESYDETQLEALLEKLKNLNNAIKKDKESLRDRNRTQLFEALINPLQSFNTALEEFSRVVNNNVSLFPSSLEQSILALNEMISGQKTWKPYEELVIDNKKAEMISVEKQQSIADQLQQLTTQINEAKEEIKEKQAEAKRQEKEKQTALVDLQNAVSDLNSFIPQANTSLAQTKTLLPSDLVNELNTFSNQFEAPSSWSFFSPTKVISTEKLLKPIQFDKKECEKYTLNQLKKYIENVRSLCEKLKTTLEISPTSSSAPPQKTNADSPTPDLATSSPPITAVPAASTSPKIETNEAITEAPDDKKAPTNEILTETAEELFPLCKALAPVVLEKLKQKTEKGDTRRTKFQEAVMMVKTDKQNPKVLEAALNEFRQIAKDFLSDEEIEEIESSASSPQNNDRGFHRHENNGKETLHPPESTQTNVKKESSEKKNLDSQTHRNDAKKNQKRTDKPSSHHRAEPASVNEKNTEDSNKENRNPVENNPIASTKSNSEMDKFWEENKNEREQLIKLLTTVKQAMLEEPLHTLKYHRQLLSKTLTTKERKHIDSVIADLKQKKTEIEKKLNALQVLNKVSELGGYELCLLSNETDLTKIECKPGKLYFKEKIDYLTYTVINPSGNTVSYKIDKKSLPPALFEKPLTEERLREFYSEIIKITSRRGDTLSDTQIITDTIHTTNNIYKFIQKIETSLCYTESGNFIQKLQSKTRKISDKQSPLGVYGNVTDLFKGISNFVKECNQRWALPKIQALSPFIHLGSEESAYTSGITLFSKPIPAEEKPAVPTPSNVVP